MLCHQCYAAYSRSALCTHCVQSCFQYSPSKYIIQPPATNLFSTPKPIRITMSNSVANSIPNHNPHLTSYYNPHSFSKPSTVCTVFEPQWCHTSCDQSVGTEELCTQPMFCTFTYLLTYWLTCVVIQGWWGGGADCNLWLWLVRWRCCGT